jgi:hypothetical protein
VWPPFWSAAARRRFGFFGLTAGLSVVNPNIESGVEPPHSKNIQSGVERLTSDF